MCISHLFTQIKLIHTAFRTAAALYFFFSSFLFFSFPSSLFVGGATFFSRQCRSFLSSGRASSLLLDFLSRSRVNENLVLTFDIVLLPFVPVVRVRVREKRPVSVEAAWCYWQSLIWLQVLKVLQAFSPVRAKGREEDREGKEQNSNAYMYTRKRTNVRAHIEKCLKGEKIRGNVWFKSQWSCDRLPLGSAKSHGC